jgi:hypothetical protein
METNDVQTQTGSGSYEQMLADLKMPGAAAPKQEEVITPPNPADDDPNTQPVDGENPKDTDPQTQPTEGWEDPAAHDPNKETIFEINDFNQRFSTEFSDEAQIKEALGAVERLTGLEAQIKELESLKEENLLLKENLDPMKYFTSEDAFKIEQFRKQFPDKAGDVAYKLFTSDVKGMSDKDVLAYNMMLDDPELDHSTALEVVERDYNLEDGEEMDKVTAAKMRKDARIARGSIEKIKSEINLPDKVSTDALTVQQRELQAARQEKLKEGWSNVAKEISKNLPDLVITDTVEGKEQEVFKYSISKDFPQEMVDKMVSVMVQNGREIDKDAAVAMMEVAKQTYVSNNFDKIAKAIREDALARAEEARLKKQHNPGTPKSQGEPTKNKSKDGQQELLANLGGFQPTRMFK